MASLYGSNHTSAYQTVPASAFPVGDFGGRLRVLVDSYALTGDLSANDTISMGKLPKGAKLVDAILSWDALSAGTLHVGWAASSDGTEAADDDGIMQSVAVTAAGHANLAENNIRTAFLKEFAAEVEVQVKVATDTSATSGTIKLCVLYVID